MCSPLLFRNLSCLPLICYTLFLGQENELEWLLDFHFKFCLAYKREHHLSHGTVKIPEVSPVVVCYAQHVPTWRGALWDMGPRAHLLCMELISLCRTKQAV